MARSRTKSQGANRKPKPSGSGGQTLGSVAHMGATQVLSGLHMAGLLAVLLAFTPYTFNLDDIKMTLFLCFGGVLLAACLVAGALGVVARPGRWVGGALIAYALVLIVSTIASKFSWAGWIHLAFFAACVGFFLGGVVTGSRPETARFFLVFVVLVYFVVLCFGFFQYDLFGIGGSGMSWLHARFYGDMDVTAANLTPARQLFFTFATETQRSLMSTVLNRDFYAAFCLLYLPFAMVLGLTTKNTALRGASLVSTLFSFISIFLCQSKGEYFVSAVAVVFFLGLYLLVVRRATVRNAYMFAWAGGILLFVVMLLVVNSPTLFSQLKAVSYSMTSRRIIFAGAWAIFGQFPLLGAGPGAFKLYFPQHRADDYFNHEISNVTIFSHNYILDILSETGLAGALTFGAFAIGLAVFAFRAMFRTDKACLRLMFLAALTGLLGMYGSNMTSPNGRWPIGAVGLWSVMGLLAGLIRQAEGWSPRPFLGSTARSGSALGELGDRIPWARPVWIGVAALVGLSGLTWTAREGIRYWGAATQYNEGKQNFLGYREHAIRIMSNPAAATPAERQFVTQRIEDASQAFANAIVIYPQHLSSYYQRGSVENLLSNLLPERAAEHLDASKEMYEALQGYAPDYAELHYNLGVIYFRLAGKTNQGGDGDYRENSRRYFEKMARMSQKADVLLRLGDTYAGGGDYGEAIKMFSRGAKLYPDDWRLARRLYESAEKASDVRSQAEALLELWRLRPGEISFLYGRASSALDLARVHGYDDLTARALDLAFARNPVDPVLHAWRFERAVALGEEAEALASALDHAKLGGRNEGVLREGLRLADQRGEAEEAAALTAALGGGR